MSCLIKDGKFFDQNGEESILYKELENKVGVEEAKQLFLLSHTPTFNKNVKKPLLNNFLNNLPEIPKNLRFKETNANKIRTFHIYNGKVKLGRIQLTPYKEGFKVKSTLINEKDRGKGYGKNLYIYTIKKLITENKSLYTDLYRTEDADRVWAYLKRTGLTEDSKTVTPFPQSHFYTNGEVKSDVVFEYLRNNFANTEPLNTVEKNEMSNISLDGINTSEDLYSMLKDMFFEKGLFKPNPIKMRTFYSEVEINDILSNIKTQATIKDTIERLANTDEFNMNSISFDEKFLIKQIDKNLLGKFKTNNPLQARELYLQENGGLQVDNPLIPQEELDEYSRIPVINEDGSQSYSKLIYDNAVKVVEDNKIKSAIDAVANAHPSVDTTTVEKKVQKWLLNYGLDIKNLDKADYPILNAFINNPTEENITLLEEALGFEPKIKEEVLKIEPKNRSYVYLKTVKSEEELFNELSLVKTSTPNVYHKVNKVSEEEMRDIQDNQDLTIPEYQLYKDYYNYNENTESPQNVEKVETDIEYLTDEFVADFNAEILKNPNNDFYKQFKVDENGITLKTQDMITLEKVKSFLKNGVKYSKELQDYSLISKNLPNLKETGNMNVFTKNDRRVNAVNNKMSIKTPSSNVSIIDNNTLQALNETSEFLRVGQNIYEQISEGIYKKLTFEQNINYNTFEIEAPNYSVEEVKQLQTSESKIPKLISKELEQENFSCL